MRLRRYEPSICVVAAMLAGCAGSQPPISASGAMPEVSTQLRGDSFRVLYSFVDGRDGKGPRATLIDVNGTLYGATASGGRPGCGYGSGCGTVYSISTSGTEKVLHRFARDSDGWDPFAALIDVDGTLYGTTRYGGDSECVENFGCGTVYTISTGGREKVLYRFGAYPNGTQPFAGLIEVKGTFYGTTWNGGAYQNGTVYSLSKTGVGSVLHTFASGSDGALPYAGLIDIKGTLYGTTWGGGSGCGSSGCGTVYSISMTGVENVLYSFASGSDGANPNARLIDIKGTLYGTTSPFVGCGSGGGCGTVYRISTTGAEKVLHHFGRGSDGSQPLSELIDVNGTLYGTTLTGGAASGCGKYPSGCGTVYSISTTGDEKVLHTFNGASDGEFPSAGLTEVNGMLYGTTSAGGRGCKSSPGCGTVFSLSP